VPRFESARGFQSGAPLTIQLVSKALFGASEKLAILGMEVGESRDIIVFLSSSIIL
jgi:hypothetical protein